MSQVTIYLDPETEKKLNVITADLNISKSKWIAGLIRAEITNSWPEGIINLAGAWKDFPMAETIRADMGTDAERESI